jgi:rRNA-processing protein EBP2
LLTSVIERQGADTETTNEADMFDVAVDDEISSAKPSRKDRQGPNKRQKKDEKFGFGGKKRFKKSGDAMSSGDLKGFSSKKMKGIVKQRPGKARRAGKR